MYDLTCDICGNKCKGGMTVARFRYCSDCSRKLDDYKNLLSSWRKLMPLIKKLHKLNKDAQTKES